MSITWKSMQLRIINTSRSPGPTPSASSPAVASATFSAYCR